MKSEPGITSDSTPRRLMRTISGVVLSLWLAGFCMYFFGQTLPNSGQVTRADVWQRFLIDLPTLGFGADDGLSTAPLATLAEQRFPLLFAAGAILLSSLLTGSAVVRLLLSRLSLIRLEKFVLQMAVGLSLQSVWTLCVGLTGWLSPVSVLLPALPAGLFLLLSGSGSKNSIAGHIRRSTSAADAGMACGAPVPSLAILAAGLIVALFLYRMLTGAMTPSTDFDVREYHLQGPREYFENGQISLLKHNVYTSFPFLTEMLSLDGMVLVGDPARGALAGKLVLMSFLPLTTLAVWCIGRRFGGPRVALLAAIVHATTPWTYRSAIIAYAEGGLSFYTATTVMVFLLIVSQKEYQAGRSGRGVVFLGLLAGSAMAAKYTGAVSVVIPLGVAICMTVLLSRRRASGTDSDQAVNGRARALIGVAGLFACGVFISVGPWLVRNVMDHGNPVYPLAYNVFGARDWDPELNERWSDNHSAPEHRLGLIPRHVKDVFVLNDWGSPLLLGLWIPGLLVAVKNRAARVTAVLALLNLMLWWALTHRIDRFWVPVIPLLAVGAGFSWQAVRTLTWRSCVVIAVAVVSLFNFELCQLSPLTGFNAGLADLDEAQKLTVRGDLAHLNATLPDDARVLMVGEAEVFNAEFELIYNTVFDDSLFEELLSAEPHTTEAAARQAAMLPADEVRRRLLDSRLTHVYVNWSEILRYRPTYGYAEFVQPSRFEKLQEMGILEDAVSLLTRDWESLSSSEQDEVRSWQGWESLVDSDGQFRSSIIYRIRP